MCNGHSLHNRDRSTKIIAVSFRTNTGNIARMKIEILFVNFPVQKME